jgi:hypothetical protein
MRTASGAQLDFGRVAVLFVCLVVAWVFQASPVLYPVRLLVTMMHESGHAIATLLVGGEVNQIILNADSSGKCLSLLPEGVLRRAIVGSGGYLGTSVVGAVLLLATFRFRLRRVVLGAACVWLVVMGAFYARDSFTLLFCLGTAVALGLGARFLPEVLVDMVNLFLASFTALNALFDMRYILMSSQGRAGSDAAILADATWVPAIVWAVVWMVLGVVLLAAAVYASVRGKPSPSVTLPSPGGSLPPRRF